MDQQIFCMLLQFLLIFIIMSLVIWLTVSRVKFRSKINQNFVILHNSLGRLLEERFDGIEKIIDERFDSTEDWLVTKDEQYEGRIDSLRGAIEDLTCRLDDYSCLCGRAMESLNIQRDISDETEDRLCMLEFKINRKRPDSEFDKSEEEGPRPKIRMRRIRSSAPKDDQ